MNQPRKFFVRKKQYTESFPIVSKADILSCIIFSRVIGIFRDGLKYGLYTRHLIVVHKISNTVIDPSMIQRNLSKVKLSMSSNGAFVVWHPPKMLQHMLQPSQISGSSKSGIVEYMLRLIIFRQIISTLILTSWNTTIADEA